MNLIDMYLKYTEEHEAKEIFHKWCMISSCASILSGRCWTTLGYQVLKPNLFVILTGPPASRKSAAIETMLDVLKPLTVNDVTLSSESITCKKLMEELADGVKSFTYDGATENYMNLLTVASELKSFIKPKDMDLAVLLLELFDGKVRRHRHATASCGEVELNNMSLNILAGTTHDFFLGKDFEAHVGSGLASRLIFLLANEKRFNNADPPYFRSPGGLKAKEKLQKKLFQLYNVVGYIPFLEEGKKAYHTWYKEQPLGIDKSVPRTMVPYAGRRQTYVRKLSLILWALQFIEDMTIAKEIKERHVLESLEIIKEAEVHIRLAYDASGRSPDVESLNDVEAFFKMRKGKWVKRIELEERFMKDMQQHVLDSILHLMLVELRTLETEAPAGRSIYRYVGK